MLVKSPCEQFQSFGKNPFAPQPQRGLYRIQGTTLRQLRSQIRMACQRRPGVYGMIDERGTLAYVGKSKSLRSRLLSYFVPGNAQEKAGRIIRDAAEIVWENNPTEFSALLREQQLIRNFQPRYNSQGQPRREQPTFILLDGELAPTLMLGREPKDAFFCGGPVMGVARASLAIEALNRFYGLRDCPSSQAFSFNDQIELFELERRAGCIRAEVGSCLAPCIGGCSRSKYRQAAGAARQFLQGYASEPLDYFTDQMSLAASRGNYDYAAKMRDTLEAVTWLRDRLVGLARAENEFSFIYPMEGGSRSQTAYWYLIKQGEVRGTFCAPSARVCGKKVLERLERGLTCGEGAPPGSRHAMVALITSWFNKYPDELARTFSLAEAQQRCKLQVNSTTLSASPLAAAG